MSSMAEGRWKGYSVIKLRGKVLPVQKNLSAAVYSLKMRTSA